MDNGNVVLSRTFTTELKGFAILLVVFCHIGNQFTVLTTPLGGIGVSIFLGLSAYGLAISYDRNGLKHFWRKRLISVVLPYLIIELLTIPLHPYKNIIEFLGDIFLISPKLKIGWYLNYLLLCYIIFWLSCLTAKNEKIRIILVLSTFVCIGWYYQVKGEGIRFEQSFAFAGGLLLHYKGDMLNRKKVNNCIAIISFLGAVFALGFKQTAFIRSSVTCMLCMDLLIKCLAGCTIYVVVKSIDNLQEMRYVRYTIGIVGGVSYELYLTHGYLLYMYDSTINKCMTSLIVFWGGLIAAVLLHFLVVRLQRLVSKYLIYKKAGEKIA